MRYLASAYTFELPLSSCALRGAPAPAADRVSRNCHLSSRRFTVPFTPAATAVLGPSQGDRPQSFGRFISARSLVYSRWRQRGAPRAHRSRPFYHSRYLWPFAVSLSAPRKYSAFIKLTFAIRIVLKKLIGFVKLSYMKNITYGMYIRTKRNGICF